ncbi:antibiotic biosynthesis monooxygenase [Cyclobacteriaceae bacterium]|nr:antibiotic biosynthesis monooxygenase [Cyclobacteriaceae bacterium]
MMLLRIVRMGFQEEKVLDFQKLFKNIKDKLSDFKGCQSIHLYRDQDQFNVFYTHSHWLSVDHLNKYKASFFLKRLGPR